MTYKTFPCSDRAKAKCNFENFDTERGDSTHANATYPFAMLLIGECFTESFQEDKEKQENRLRALASTSGKRLKKRFMVLKHDEHSCFEIARIG